MNLFDCWLAWRARVAAEPIEAIPIGMSLSLFKTQLDVFWGAYRTRRDYRECRCGVLVHKSRPFCGDGVECVFR
jgi:hypothetical protein